MAVAVQTGLDLSVGRLKSATSLPSRTGRSHRTELGEHALQFNFNKGGGLRDQTYFNRNIQPDISNTSDARLEFDRPNDRPAGPLSRSEPDPLHGQLGSRARWAHPS